APKKARLASSAGAQAIPAPLVAPTMQSEDDDDDDKQPVGPGFSPLRPAEAGLMMDTNAAGMPDAELCALAADEADEGLSGFKHEPQQQQQQQQYDNGGNDNEE